MHNTGGPAGRARDCAGAGAAARTCCSVMFATAPLVSHWVLLMVLTGPAHGWRAVPADQAVYASRSAVAGLESAAERQGVVLDEDLPRTYIHSIFKFGYCTPDATHGRALRRTANITLPSWQDTQASYLYLLQDKHSQRSRLQCVVMRVMVPRKYQFRRSRLPLYYCQGQLWLHFFEEINRIEVHEFYLQSNLNMPANFLFEFYHPEAL